MALKRWQNILTATEVNEREACESVIEETKLSFVKCGEALLKIRDKKLYRNTHSTFGEYCQDKWGWTRQRAHQIINAAVVVKALPKGLSTKVDNESQARALADVPKEERKGVLAEAAKDGNLTAAKITEAAAEIVEPDTHELDHVGRVIPKAILEDWNRAKETARLFTNQVSRIKCAVEEGLAKETRDIVYAEVGNGLIAALKNAYSDLSLIEPWAVCPKCGGKTRANCTTCKQRGFISEFYWNRKIDSKTKALIEGGSKK